MAICPTFLSTVYVYQSQFGISKIIADFLVENRTLSILNVANSNYRPNISRFIACFGVGYVFFYFLFFSYSVVCLIKSNVIIDDQCFFPFQ